MPSPRLVRQKLQRMALTSIAIAFVVMALKYWAYRVTGSVALYSDALESIVNVITAFVAWYAIRLSFKPEDSSHPFGHHKAEYLSAVVEGALIIVAALLILQQAWSVWNVPQALEQTNLGLAVNAVATIINAIWASMLMRAGRAHKSPAILADGKHIWTDVLTSIGVLVGLFLAISTGRLWLDPLMAVFVALNILWQGWLVINFSVQGLMDHAVDPDEEARIRTVISDNAAGAIEVHDLKTRAAARATFVEFHLVVPEKMTVSEAHDICDRIEEAVKAQVSDCVVTIHVEPEGEAKHSGVLVL
jgi:cation diffusion facilitator family transporter